MYGRKSLWSERLIFLVLLVLGVGLQQVVRDEEAICPLCGSEATTTIIQVFAKMPLLHKSVEGLVCCRDNPYINVSWLPTA